MSATRNGLRFALVTALATIVCGFAALPAWASQSDILGTWKLKDASGEVSIGGGSGAYTAVVTEPITWDCTHPVGETVWTMSYTDTAPFGGLENYAGTELWYTEECEIKGGYPALFSVFSVRGKYYMTMKSWAEGESGSSTLERVDSSSNRRQPSRSRSFLEPAAGGTAAR